MINLVPHKSALLINKSEQTQLYQITINLEQAITLPIVNQQLYEFLLVDGSSSTKEKPVGNGCHEQEMKAISAWLDTKPDGTIVTIYTFADDTRMLIEPTEINEQSRASIKERLLSSSPQGGTTNCIEGLRIYKREALKAREQGLHPNLSLFSDGLFNEDTIANMVTLSKEFKEINLNVDGYAIGSNSDVRGLQHMTSNAYYLEDPKDLKKLMKTEGSKQAVAGRLELVVELAEHKAHLLSSAITKPHVESFGQKPIKVLNPKEPIISLLKIGLLTQTKVGKLKIGKVKLMVDGELKDEQPLTIGFVESAEEVSTDFSVFALETLIQSKIAVDQVIALAAKKMYLEAFSASELINKKLLFLIGNHKNVHPSIITQAKAISENLQSIRHRLSSQSEIGQDLEKRIQALTHKA